MFWIFFLGTFFCISGLIYSYNRFYPHGHAILITHPWSGPFRYFMEWVSEYIRGHLHKDWEERPFNRLTRKWIKKSSTGKSNYISFGSEINPNEPGTIIFTNSSFPILEEDTQKFSGKLIGDRFCSNPFYAKSFFNISGMSYGALGATAIQALAEGSNLADIWINTGEGGLSKYHESANNIIFQIGSAKYGCRNVDGSLDENKLREISKKENVRAFEIKLGQGAKPGTGGILPGLKVTPEIAKVRGIPVWEDSISPNRHKEVYDVQTLMDFTMRIREITDKPVGIKIVVGGDRFLDRYLSRLQRSRDFAPDFITVDGTEGGTGAAPQSLADYVGTPLAQGLAILTNKIEEFDLHDRIKIIASGKLVTPDKVALALCMGADFVVTGRGFLLSLGCIQTMKCSEGRCPQGITTNNPRYMKALDPTLKKVRVAEYAKSVIHDVEMIAHSCGLKDPSEFRRRHAQIVTGIGKSKTLEQEFPRVKRQK